MKRVLQVIVVIGLLAPSLIIPMHAGVDTPLKCSSLVGCGDWSECPGRGREIQRCVLDCQDGPIVFCPGYQG
jgi:hypothetical protein